MKNLFLAALCLLFSATAFAQLSVGANFGANVSSWSWYIKPLDTDLDIQSAVGWRGVVTSEWKFSPVFALRAELGAQMKSRYITVVTDGNGQVYEDDIRVDFHFFESSLLLEVAPFTKWKNLFFTAGASNQYLRKAVADIAKIPIEGNPETIELNIEENTFTRNTIAADFGIGGNIPVSTRGKIKIEGRYQLGLNNFSTSPDVEARTSNFGLNIGYLHQL